MNRLMRILAMGMLPKDACLYKGGKGKGSAPKPIVSPVPPSEAVEDASIISENNKDDRTNTSKESLKVPLEISEKAGLSNVSSGGTTGLKA